MAFPLMGDARNSIKLAVDFYLGTQVCIAVLKTARGNQLSINKHSANTLTIEYLSFSTVRPRYYVRESCTFRGNLF
jgi:hypothetical protein